MSKDLEKARDYACRLLGYRLRTCHEMASRLKDKGFSDEVVTSVIETMLEYRYLDDLEFARMWIRNRCNLKPMGKWRLKQELKAKGISEPIIREALMDITDEEEYQLALRIANKKMMKSTVQQIKNFLFRRGFSGEVVARITENMDN